MPFRLWFYLSSSVGGCVVFAILWASTRAPTEGVLGLANIGAICLVFLLALIGAAMRILMVLGRLRMLCPFCGKSGLAGGNKRDGLFMRCDSCGFVHGGGLMGLKIVREPIEDAAAELSDAADSR